MVYKSQTLYNYPSPWHYSHMFTDWELIWHLSKLITLSLTPLSPLIPNYWSAKIKQFGQTPFSILQQKLKHGMIQIRLLKHPSKFCKHETMYTPCLLLEIWDLCIIKAEHIWHLNLPIMKYETYWYR